MADLHGRSSEKASVERGCRKRGLTRSSSDSRFPSLPFEGFTTVPYALASVYDVVLSIGDDTRLNFTYLLYRALTEKGILTFVGKPDEWGIDLRFHRAIEGSKMLIPIISKGYGSSERCLLELEQMLRRRTYNQLVWPVFFEVEPSDVSDQTGSFEKPFEKYEMECHVDIVKRWRQALREISSMKGYVVRESGGFETAKLIVERALMGLGAMTCLDDTTVLEGSPDGTDFHTECMLHLLHLDSMDVRFVGICGLHGSVNATIAETIYHKILNRFEGSSFLENVNARASMPTGLISLRSQLLRNILVMYTKIRTAHLDSKKVLIVLHDVGDCRQINALVHNANWLGAGSRVIITTKDERILDNFKVDVVYRPEILDEYQSLVLGSKLFLHSINEEESTLQKINDASDDRLQMINLLSHRGRQIILNEKSKEPVQRNDTAENNYFFIHLFVWGQFKGLTVLNLSHCSSLVKIPDISSLQLLKRLILEDCHELVDLHESIGMIKGLIDLNLKSCDKLVQLQGSACQFVALENLSLSNCGSLKRLPEWSSNLKLLVVLDLSSTKISELPDGVGLMEKLVMLNVNGCTNLVKLPRSMGKMRQLQHFSMSRTGIIDLPDDFLMLPSLNILEMAKCTKLKGFPSNEQYTSGVSFLSCLQVLDLEHCKRLESLPELSSALLELNVLGCRSLPIIDLCNLHNLKAFCFGGCDKMVEIPYGFEELFLLEKLVLCLISSDCLLATVLSRLKHLALLDCRNLKSLPELPSSLIELQLIGCISLEKLPDLTSLKNLKVLNLTGCAKLEEIQGLEELKSLTLYDVTLCYLLTDTSVKVLGQGTMKDESFEYELGGDIIDTNFVIGDGVIGQQLVMCLAFSSGHSTTDSCFHGLSDDCILQFEASIARDGRQIDCINDLVVNVNMSSKDEMLIYIHYFKGCDWFGFPLLHGDVIQKLKISSLTGEWSLEFFHLLMENSRETPSQQPNVENVKLFFNWTDEMDNTELHCHPKPIDGKTLTSLSRMRQYCQLHQ